MSTPSTPSRAPILDELRGKPETHAASLASAMVDDILVREIRSLVNPQQIAAAWAEGLRATVDSENFPDWLQERAEDALDRAEAELDGTLGENLGSEISDSLRRFVSHPFKADPELVRSVLKHRRVRGMLGEGLRGLLTDFGQFLLSAVPGAGRAGALAGIMDMARNMASVVRAELDKQLEGKVTEFVDDTLDRGIDKWAKSLATESHARKSARKRAEILDVLLEQPVQHLLAIPRAAGVASICRAVTEEMRALASWDGLEEEIAASIDSSLDIFGSDTLADFLEDSDLVESWRPPIESLLAGYLEQLFLSEPFANWLTGLEVSVGEAGKASSAKASGSKGKKTSRKKAPAKKKGP